MITENSAAIDGKPNVSRSILSPETQYRIFMSQLISDISDLAGYIFDPKTDPEVQWELFRKELKKIKKEQVIRWIELDAS